MTTLNAQLSQMLFFAMVVAPICALIHLARKEMPGGDKVVWALIILCIPIVGSLIYVLFGRRRASNKQ